MPTPKNKHRKEFEVVTSLCAKTVQMKMWEHCEKAEELPRYLYRVQYPGTQTIWGESGLRNSWQSSHAAWGIPDTQWAPLFQGHLNNNGRNALPYGRTFISVLPSEAATREWLHRLEHERTRWPRNIDPLDWNEVQVLTIDTQWLEDPKIWKASKVIEKLRLNVRNRDSHASEYLVYDRIPDRAIAKVQLASQFLSDEQTGLITACACMPGSHRIV